MPTVTATATAPRSAAPLDLSIPRTDAPKRQRCQDRDEAGHCDAAAPRRNPLVAAMMQALGSLMPSSKTTAAPDSKAAATDASSASGTATATADASSSLKDAAMAFAHELFDALRSTGSGRDGRDSASERGRVHGHGHGHHHHGRGYGDLAQRLERLAAEVAAPAKPAQPAPTDGTAVSLTASLTTASISTTSGAADGSSTTSVNLTTVNLSLTQQSAQAQAPKESPLLSAFRKLFDALQPATGGDAAKPDAASGLSTFLRQLAQSLR
ncbi:MAG: hypothetical protein KA265_12575, partial [Piscinibacter sp.]|nr:hypothetical protein [Piscinibacter sp.]